MLYIQLLPLLHKLSVQTDNGFNVLNINTLSPKMHFRNCLIINHYRFYRSKRTVGVFFGKKHRICPRALFLAFMLFFGWLYEFITEIKNWACQLRCRSPMGFAIRSVLRTTAKAVPVGLLTLQKLHFCQ